MNWKQLYTATASHDRIDLILHALRIIERRQRRLILVLPRSFMSIIKAEGWVIVQERRHPARQCHFINDRRRSLLGAKNTRVQGFSI